MQFIFGNLLSALFILYFKSTGIWLAWLLIFLLGFMLVANEYLEDEYKQFTLSWALFGFVIYLLFNFCLPFMVGGDYDLVLGAPIRGKVRLTGYIKNTSSFRRHYASWQVQAC